MTVCLSQIQLHKIEMIKVISTITSTRSFEELFRLAAMPILLLFGSSFPDNNLA